MSVETEIKFLLSAPVARALSRDLFAAAVARADHLDTTYFDTPAGHALFSILDAGKLKKPENLAACFDSIDSTRKLCPQQTAHASPLRVAELGVCYAAQREA